MRIKGAIVGSFVVSSVLLACSSAPDDVTQDDEVTGQQEQALAPGALVDVSMDSQVGVLLDEVPPAMRDRVAATILAKPGSFWKARAQRQVQLANYRLVFRNVFYGPRRQQLPLPPEESRQIVLKSNAKRVITNKHDTIVVDYRFKGTLLTDAESPGVSEPKLKNVGGVWNEDFTFPVDPELLFQRTRYACMDEDQFPIGSVDSEEVDSFYDQDCEDEETLSRFGQCHATERPFRSCRQALRDNVGLVDTQMKFERVAWNNQRANEVRISRMRPNVQGADLQVVQSEFQQNRIIYKYFEPNSCEFKEEKCLGGSGWRRLLQFSTSDENIGNRTLDIGAVNYYIDGDSTLNDQYHIFEYSSCHEHYHFTHYGTFSLGNDSTLNAKKGFCLQSTSRASNHELSPLHNPYYGCDYQGVEVGWTDQYKAGLPCQWLDITDVPTGNTGTTKRLGFHSNPDKFLCEGKPILDSNGNPKFEPTEFRTATGEVVYRPKCNFTSNWDSNNEDSYNVNIPTKGNGFITTECNRGQVGPLRNCGFHIEKAKSTCTPGTNVKLSCKVKNNGKPQALRVCEYSNKLQTGLACKYEDSVASKVVDKDGTNVQFRCPAQRGAGEPGGSYSLYGAPVIDEDAASQIECTEI